MACDYSRADWDGLLDYLRHVPWEDIFKVSTSGTASEFYEWVQVGIDVHRKYQVKPHSSPLFSAACVVAIIHRNHFFRLYQQNKSSESEVKFRQASNRCKRVLEAAKLAYATKTTLPRNLALRTTAQRCCLLHLMKQNYLLKTFPRTLILMTLLSLYLFPHLELI